MSNYQRIEQAINYLLARASSQPRLEDIAASVHLSPFHFQRVFSQWAGVTPKQFLQILTLERAKELLAQSKPLLNVSDELGLSSASRLHDHFVKLEAVTPGEFTSRGAGVTINYAPHKTPFGDAFVAATERGICSLAFLPNECIEPSLDILKAKWPRANLVENQNAIDELMAGVFVTGKLQAGQSRPISLHVRGTHFQIKVWQALLQIPEGFLSSYSEVAQAVGNPKAVRAVGSAIGANPVGFIIPCHRVIRQSGELGGYRWGETRKHALHAWESARRDAI